MSKHIDGLPAIDTIDEMNKEMLGEFLALGICYVKKDLVNNSDAFLKAVKVKSQQFFNKPQEEKSLNREYNDRRVAELKEHVERLSFPVVCPSKDFQGESKELLSTRDELLQKIVSPLIYKILNHFGKSELADQFVQPEGTFLSIVSYPQCEPMNDSTIVGLRKHKDLGLITVLALNEMGLKRRQNNDKADDWVDVKPDPDYFVVICGKALQLLLGKDKCHAPSHKVELNGEKRLSTGMFFNPPSNASIANVFTGEQLFENFFPHYISQMTAKYK